MLTQLRVQNFALINDLTIDFKSGFNIITGETGAGKSILLGALGLLSGKRADSAVVNGEGKKCVVEGEFSIQDYNLGLFFEENDIDFESTTILRREILSSGKSRAFVNDTPVNLNQLKQLGEKLIDIHSQHANTLLSTTSFVYSILDGKIISNSALAKYQKLFKDWNLNSAEIKLLIEKQEKDKLNVEFNEFQYRELKEANLVKDEQEELEREFDLLNNAELIRENSIAVSTLLVEGEDSVVDLLGKSTNGLEKLSPFNPTYQELLERVKSVAIEIKDIGEEINALGGELSSNESRCQEIDERLGLLFSLQKKFGVASVDHLIEKREELKVSIESVEGGGGALQELIALAKAQELELVELGKVITVSRKKNAEQIEQLIVKDLAMMGISEAKFKFDFLPSDLNVFGSDVVEVKFSANKGKKLEAISKTASGGEVSRVMLSLKRILSSKLSLPTIIFDEIDTGVSGDVADKMGDVMGEMSKKMQVVAITHLPQIAAKGDAHFKVYKSHSAESTTSSLMELTGVDRVEELAKMLSGAKVTDAAINNARDLLGI